MKKKRLIIMKKIIILSLLLLIIAPTKAQSPNPFSPAKSNTSLQVQYDREFLPNRTFDGSSIFAIAPSEVFLFNANLFSDDFLTLKDFGLMQGPPTTSGYLDVEGSTPFTALKIPVGNELCLLLLLGIYGIGIFLRRIRCSIPLG
jgi:hypothetical protein